MNKLVVVLALIHLGIACFVNLEILGGIPHIPDSAIYYRQAILLSQGKLYVSNFAMEHRDAFTFMGHFIRDDTLFVTYPHFWPLLMSGFIKLGVPWFVNPLLSAVCLLLIFLIARKLFDEKTGIIAALLYCFSPLSILMGVDYQMHAATLFFILLAFYFVLRYFEAQKPWIAFLAGLSLGYAFALRPLTAIGVFAPIGVYLLIYYRKQVFSWRSAWFILGFGVMFALLLADNYVMTGNTLKISHPIGSFLNDPESVFSLANIQSGLNHSDTTLPFISPVIFYNFIPHLLLAIAFIPIIVLRRRQDILLLCIFLSLVGVYMLTYAEGLHGYGPRYYYESFFALFILAAQGIMWIVEQFSGARKKIVIGVLAILMIYNIYGLITILPQYRDYNYIPSDSAERLEALDLANSIVVVGKSWNWFEDGITAVFYDPEYKKSFFIREMENGEHLKVLEQYPDKKVYKIVNTTYIIPFELNTTNSTSLNTTIELGS